MVNKTFANEQAGRFAGLEGFPVDVRGFNEIRKACQHAPTEATLLAFVDDWIRYNVKAPKPAQIMEKLHEEGQKLAAALKSCEQCGGSGWITVTGKSPWDGLEVSGARQCPCGQLGQPIKREADCSRCQGHGIYGGETSGPYAGPWKWCLCFYGRERQQREPFLVSEANQARDKLIRRFGAKPLPAMAQQASEEVYHGDF